MENLRRAIDTICREDFVPALVDILVAASDDAQIDYSAIEQRAGDSTQELLLFAWEQKLLIPRSSLRCAEWDDRMMILTPGQTYEMPNIARYLVETAMETGKWDPSRAVAALYRDMGAPDWKKIPALVQDLAREAVNGTLRGTQIAAARVRAGIKDSTGAIIAILKGGGIISPKLAPMGPAGKAGTPIYELNPSVCPPGTLSAGPQS
jgi:hypothetical protein